MKISYNWLKEYININFSPEELAYRLTMIGIETIPVEVSKEDVILELEIMPNRPDCLSIIGIAREIKTLTGQKISFPQIKIENEKENISNLISVSLEDEKKCLRYTACVIQDVEIKDSPAWLKEKLNKVGIKSVNNIVDITNFTLLELGQPLHAFDLDKIEGSKIVIREAFEEENIIGIDGYEYKLSKEMLVIADSKKPIALAGLIGGKNTEVEQNTRNILLESAYFEPKNIRRTSKKFNLVTESSYRFEREVDFQGVLKALKRAAQLITEITHGKIKGFIDIKKKEEKEKIIIFNKKKIKKLLAIDFPNELIVKILELLDFSIIEKKEEIFTIKVPSFRVDITCETDIIEELIRIIGYDKIKPTLPKGEIKYQPLNLITKIEKKIRETLINCDLYEIITFSFCDKQKLLELFPNSSKEIIKIQNPLSCEQSVMRTSLIPNLLQTLKWNYNHQVLNVKIFEIGKIYFKKDTFLTEERRMVSGLITGTKITSWLKKEKVNFFDIKGIIETLFKNLRINYKITNTTYPIFENFQSAAIEINNQIVGNLGKIKEEILKKYKLPFSVFLFEIDIETILPYINLKIQYEPISKYPAVIRDISFYLKESIPYEEIFKTITQEELIENVYLIDLYEGKPIPKGNKNLTFSITYKAKDRTLTNEEVETIHEKTKKILIQKFDACIR